MTDEMKALLICSEMEGDTPCSECPLFKRCKSEQSGECKDYQGGLQAAISALTECFKKIAEDFRAFVDLAEIAEAEPPITKRLACTAHRLPFRVCKPRSEPHYIGKLYKIIPALFRSCGARCFRYAKIKKQRRLGKA